MLKAGFARVDITPPLGTYLSGYFRDRFADGVLDPLELNALALSFDGKTVVIIAADILGITVKYTNEIRAIVSERVGIPTSDVLICALHQHTSFALRDTAANNVMRDSAYLDVLYRKFADVAQMSINDLTDATLAVDKEQTEQPIAFVRRWMMTDGTIVTNPSITRRHELDHPLGDADNTVRLLRFSRSDARDIALINFSTHPDVVGGTKFSADWPGFARRYVESALDDVSCMMLLGVQGDANHFDFHAEKRGKGRPHAEYMGRMIADAVVRMWDRAEAQEVDRLGTAFRLVYNKTRTDGLERYEECKAYLAEQKRRQAEGLTQGYNENGAQISEATRIVNIRNQTLYQRIPVTVASIGNVGLVGIGGEPFMHYAEAIRNACPDRFIVVSCLTNGFENYLPTASAFAEGGYEADRTPYTPSVEEETVGAAVEMLNSI